LYGSPEVLSMSSIIFRQRLWLWLEASNPWMSSRSAYLLSSRASKIALSRAILVPGIWTSSLSHRSIFWPIDWIFRIPLVITWRPEIPAFLTAFPRTTVLILIVGIAHTKAFMLHLASPPASKRHKGRITTDPLLTTRRFDLTSPLCKFS